MPIVSKSVELDVVLDGIYLDFGEFIVFAQITVTFIYDCPVFARKVEAMIGEVNYVN